MNWKELESALESGWDAFIVQNEDRDGIPIEVIHSSNAEVAIGNAKLQPLLGYWLYGGEGGTFDLNGERRRIYCVHMRDPEAQFMRTWAREGAQWGSWDSLQKYRVDDGEGEEMEDDEVTCRYKSKVDLTRFVNLDCDGNIEKICGFADPILAVLYGQKQVARGYKIFIEAMESSDEKCRTYCVYLKHPTESCPNPLMYAPRPGCGAN